MADIKQYLSGESGQAMAEYGLVLALIVTAVLGALTAFGEARENMYIYIMGKLSEVIGR